MVKKRMERCGITAQIDARINERLLCACLGLMLLIIGMIAAIAGSEDFRAVSMALSTESVSMTLLIGWFVTLAFSITLWIAGAILLMFGLNGGNGISKCDYI